jgi:hemerythrin-like domain-containing protein
MLQATMTHKSIQIIQDEHAALSAMLRSLGMMIERGPGSKPESFFDVVRAMLFYIDEFPEKRHHPKETALLFPPVAARAPAVRAAVERLTQEHEKGEAAVRQLQHLLLAWELLGEPRRKAFEVAFAHYMHFYREHMQLEEEVIIPQALQVLTESDWRTLDEAFATNCDPLTGRYARDPVYEQLFSKITLQAPAPIGLGDA